MVYAMMILSMIDAPSLTRHDAVSTHACSILGILVISNLGNKTVMLVDIGHSILCGVELDINEVWGATIIGCEVELDWLKCFKPSDKTVDVGARTVEHVLVVDLIINGTLFVEVSTKVDVVDELLEFVLGHCLNTVIYCHCYCPPSCLIIVMIKCHTDTR